MERQRPGRRGRARAARAVAFDYEEDEFTTAPDTTI
eukprot:SAG31_NODE_35783_length_320_cov_0.552036_2_plen_35_part_01